MKQLMKLKKNISGIKACINSGSIVIAVRNGETYTISPIESDTLILKGVPDHYLVQLSPDECLNIK